MRRRSDELSRSKSDAFRKYFKALYREIRIKKREGRIITIPDDPNTPLDSVSQEILDECMNIAWIESGMEAPDPTCIQNCYEKFSNNPVMLTACLANCINP